MSGSGEVVSIEYVDVGPAFSVVRHTRTALGESYEQIGLVWDTDTGWTWRRYDGRVPDDDKVYDTMRVAGAAMLATNLPESIP